MKTTEKNAIIAKIFAAVVSAVLIVIGAVAACLSMGEVRASEGSTSAGEHVLTLSWAEAEGVSEDGKTYTATPVNATDTLHMNLSLDIGNAQDTYAPGEIKIILPYSFLIAYDGQPVASYVTQKQNGTAVNLSSIYTFSCGYDRRPFINSSVSTQCCYYQKDDNIIIENAVELHAVFILYIHLIKP